jgi:GMP synthase (glutamine-hydrolysing)
MSHGDEVTRLPSGFVQTARSAACSNVAAENAERRLFGFQFHPEVVHTEGGMEMLGNFVKLCTGAAVWDTNTFVASAVLGCLSVFFFFMFLLLEIKDEILKQVGDRNVFILVSGGVDSTVAYTLLQQILRDPKRVHGLLVDNGFMRHDEVSLTQWALSSVGFAQLHIEDASETFFNALKDVYDPEKKRVIIGQTFLDVKDRVAKQLKLDSDQWLLGQGTIYPGMIVAMQRRNPPYRI